MEQMNPIWVNIIDSHIFQGMKNEKHGSSVRIVYSQFLMGCYMKFRTRAPYFLLTYVCLCLCVYVEKVFLKWLCTKNHVILALICHWLIWSHLFLKNYSFWNQLMC